MINHVIDVNVVLFSSDVRRWRQCRLMWRHCLDVTSTVSRPRQLL